MNLFKKIFGASSSKSEEVSKTDQSPYMETPSLPVDEQFTFNFKKNGGKFLYCDTLEELNEQFENILVENDWFEQEVLCFEPTLFNILEENRLIYTHTSKPKFAFCTCESLIATDGSILFSSTQFKHFKSSELPESIVVFATTSQLRANKSDGLTVIKKKYVNGLPSNITTITQFESVKEKEQNFLQQGSIAKNLYLLLLEDL